MKILIVCFLLIGTFYFAQKEGFQWVLSGGASSINDTFRNMIVDFHDNTTNLIYTGNRIAMIACNASICDQDGQLLFYTNGESIYNMAYDTVENGGLLIPGNAGNSGYPLPQSQLMFHYPGHPGKVMMFSGDHFYSLYNFPDGL